MTSPPPHFIYEIKTIGSDVIGVNFFLLKLMRFPLNKTCPNAAYHTTLGEYEDSQKRHEHQFSTWLGLILFLSFENETSIWHHSKPVVLFILLLFFLKSCLERFYKTKYHFIP